MNPTIEPPTQSGAYWFQPEPLSREMLVQVRETKGVLTVWWPLVPSRICVPSRWNRPEVRHRNGPPTFRLSYWSS
jgi:hypothetical protein